MKAKSKNKLLRQAIRKSQGEPLPPGSRLATGYSAREKVPGDDGLPRGFLNSHAPPPPM